MKAMKLLVSVLQDEEGWYVAECPAIPGCVSQGRTLDEALENIHEAAELCMQVRREQGLPTTVQTFEIEMRACA